MPQQQQGIDVIKTLSIEVQEAEKGLMARRRKSFYRLKIPEVGLEPTQYCYYWILSPARLPFRHSGSHFSHVSLALQLLMPL